MATFKDVQESFQNGDTSKYRCIAIIGNKHERCLIELTPGQKENLARMFREDQDELDVDDLRTIICDVLCSRHQTRNYKGQVEARWREEFSAAEFPKMNFSQIRSPSRTTKLSRPSTPKPNTSSSKSNLSPPSSSSSFRSHNQVKPELQSLPPGGQPSFSAAEDTVLETIEPNSPQVTSGEVDKGDDGDLSQFVSTPAKDYSIPIEGLDLRNGLLDHRWGDSSETVSGKRDNNRRIHVYFLRNGEVKKEAAEDANELPEVEGLQSEDARHITPRESAVVTPPDVLAHASRDAESSPSPTSRKRASPYPKSRSRTLCTRSPSAPPTTPREVLAWSTMEGDAMYDRPPQVNERNVVQMIKREIPGTGKSRLGKPGWVYAIRDPNLDLVKIGYTTEAPPLGLEEQAGHKRLKAFERDCKASEAFILGGISQVSVLAFRRLEGLIHEDLRPHRWYFECECGMKRGRKMHNTEHHEWYKITDQVAIDTVKLWRDFILQGPYGDLSENEDHHLQSDWIKKLDRRTGVDVNEKHEDHERRIKRWRSLFQSEGSPEDADMKSRGLRDIKIEEDLYNNLSLQDIPTLPVEPANAPSRPELKSPSFELNGSHHSLTTSPATSTGLVSRSNSRDTRSNDKKPTVSQQGPRQQHQEQLSGSAESPEATQIGSTERAEANNIHIHDFAAKSFAAINLLGTLDTFLQRHHAGLPSRSAYDDIYTFRWAFSTAIILAMYSSYVPPHLSTLSWAIFLPFFVAELREWHREEADQSGTTGSRSH